VGISTNLRKIKSRKGRGGEAPRTGGDREVERTKEREITQKVGGKEKNDRDGKYISVAEKL